MLENSFSATETGCQKSDLAGNVVLHERVCAAELAQTVEVKDERPESVNEARVGTVLPAERFNHFENGGSHGLEGKFRAPACRADAKVQLVRSLVITHCEKRIC